MRHGSLLEFLLSCSIATSGCVAVVRPFARATNVFRGDASVEAQGGGGRTCAGGRTVDTRDSTVARVDLDRYGDVSPGVGLGSGIPNAAARRADESLMETFAYRRLPRRDSSDGRNWEPVLDALGFGPDLASDVRLRPVGRRREIGAETVAAWRAVQTAIRPRLAADVRAAVERAGGETLIVLCHGFNVEDPECAYAAMPARSQRASPQGASRAAYLLVSWDGLVGLNEAGSLTIWSKAQYTFPLVGMGLRRLMNEPDLPHPVDVRGITHSAGGPVAGHVFWDGSRVLGPEPDAYSAISTRPSRARCRRCPSSATSDWE